MCHTHEKIRYKEKHPIRYAYSVLKNNAKRRKIPFNLTIEEFIKFCTLNNYIENKGRFGHSYTIDRKIPWIGYTYDNLQILTNSQNVRKMWIDIKIANGGYPTEEELQSIISPIQSSDTTYIDVQEDDSVPF